MQNLSEKSNQELISVLVWSSDKAEKAEAWAQLLRQAPSNSDLCYLIRYTDLKAEAWAQLLRQAPSNSDLIFVVKSCPDLKLDAARVLRERYGVHGSLDEPGLMQSIAAAVIERPGSLKMDSWHCGTSHCIGGWACVLSEYAAKIEKATDAETAAHAMLPSYSHLFYIDNKTALAELQKIADQK